MFPRKYTLEVSLELGEFVIWHLLSCGIPAPSPSRRIWPALSAHDCGLLPLSPPPHTRPTYQFVANSFPAVPRPICPQTTGIMPTARPLIRSLPRIVGSIAHDLTGIPSRAGAIRELCTVKILMQPHEYLRSTRTATSRYRQKKCEDIALEIATISRRAG